MSITHTPSAPVAATTVANASVATTPAIRLHRTEEEVLALRPFWETHQIKPNSDLDHFLLVCRLRPQVLSPYAISLWDETGCRAIVAGRLERALLRPALGYLRLPAIAVRQLSVLYDGIIGELSRSDVQVVLAELQAAGKRGEMDLTVFNSLPEASLFWRQWLERGNPSPELWSEHWHLRLPREPGFLVRSMKSKHRSWAKRKAAEFEDAYRGRSSWKWIKEIDDLATLCQQLESVAAQTYQRGLGAGFHNDSLHRERLGLFSRLGRLRVMLLEIDQKPAAFWYGVVYRDTFFSEATGYLTALRDYEIGTQLFLRIVDELIAENVAAFDFGLGDAAYKKRFGDSSWREAELRMYGPGVRALLTRHYLSNCEQANALLKRTVSRLGLTDRIKTAWRKRLAQADAGQPTNDRRTSGEEHLA